MAKVANTASEFSSLFPTEFLQLLNASGKQFIVRTGQDLVRQATLQVLLGHNVRTQTEPLTRQRIGEVGGAIIAMFERGARRIPRFYEELSRLAATEVVVRGPNGPAFRPSQWVLGLTGKSMQNVLRSDANSLNGFIATFDTAIKLASEQLETALGPLRLSLSVGPAVTGNAAPLSWKEALRLTTAIGCSELAVRGSDKSRYGKLFERLVLGSVLSVLGFAFDTRGEMSDKAFWLSDSTGDRECDATLIFKPGTIVRFDIGFIGIGNPEIVRDKLSRFAREVERGKRSVSSITVVIVDRYPTGPNSNSKQLAEQSGTSLIQMSMSLWPRELARELRDRLGFVHPIVSASDAEAEAFIRERMSNINVLKFLAGAPEDISDTNDDLPIDD